MDTSWMNNPNLSGIDPAKLQRLLSLAQQGQQKKQNELLPFIMAAASQSKEKGMSFSPQETDAIIEVLKMGKSPEEIQRIEKMRSMVQLFLQNQNAKPPL